MDHSRAPEQPSTTEPSPFHCDTEALGDRIRRGEYTVDPELVAQAFIDWHRIDPVRPADQAEL
ncbi:MAG: hypothetical protein ACR2KQ_03145 [Actinomycetota bacterium]